MKLKKIAIAVSLGFIVAFSASLFAREPFTFEERVKAQEAIERVYYNHRIWPKENPQPKPPFEKMVTKEQIEAKVKDYIKKSAALDQYWQRPIEGKQLQAEMNRMARGTRTPEVLEELFHSLGDDPGLIAECLAGPALVNRMIREQYRSDERLHASTKKNADDFFASLPSANFRDPRGGEYRRIIYRLSDDQDGGGKTRRETIGVSPKEFQELGSIATENGKYSAVMECDDAYYICHTLSSTSDELEMEIALFRKEPLESWLERMEPGCLRGSVPPPPNGYFLPELGTNESECEGTWNNGSLDDMPDPRTMHTAVWTGSEMIIWGGWGGVFQRTGGRYNPSIDSWSETSTGHYAPTPRTYHSAVWTGNEMIIWGGEEYDGTFLNTGAKYDPLLDSWTSVSTGTGCPKARSAHAAVWTGSEMIIWGGDALDYPYDTTGSRYDPRNDSWTPMSTAGAPEGRIWLTAIWTGKEMIVWGGCYWGYPFYIYLNSGGVYNPSTDKWKGTSVTGNTPCPRGGHSAVWTGSKMIIWGGTDEGYISFSDGALYDPSSNSWTPTSRGANVPQERYSHTAVWTGSEMIVWGGTYIDPEWETFESLNTGARYKPASDKWTTISDKEECPSERMYHTAVWTGSEMIVWGGNFVGGSTTYKTGGRYSPSTDSWKSTSVGGDIPIERSNFSGVWTGAEMIIWGGYIQSYVTVNSGGRYNPALDSWESTSTGSNCPTGRWGHKALWTGSEMIVWGGSGDQNTGGRYNPLADSWRAISTGQGVPAGRNGLCAVWTGSNMIVWGGKSDDECVDTGGLYDPLTDIWKPTSTGAGVPSRRNFPQAVWTGKEMIVWGGKLQDDTETNTGGRYNPSTDAWSPTSLAENVPVGRSGFSTIWTGTEMIIWGGGRGSTWPLYLNDGGRYNPVSNSWKPLSIGESTPSTRSAHSAVWTGSEMIIWGGFYFDRNWRLSFDDGGIYDPADDSWKRLAAAENTPSPRAGHYAAWTGSKMIVWGGSCVDRFNSGGILDPFLGCSARCDHDQGAPPLLVNFTADANSCSGTPEFLWTFGDGETSSEQNPGHTYTSEGIFNWTVEVSSGEYRCSSGGSVVISNVQPPNITSVQKLADPFRLKISGSGFQEGVAVYIGTSQIRWTELKFKSSGEILLKGGSALRSMFPKGTPVEISVVNEDGGSASFYFTR